MAEMGEPARRPGSRAFVGRDRELAELVAGLDDALGGRGRLFLIAGEPGIGKTWLVEYLAGHATKQGTRVLWGRCWEGGGAPPYWPWTQMIRTLAESRDVQTLASWLGAEAAHIAQLVPDLAEHLGTTTISAAPARESDAARFYLFEAVTGLFRRAASAQPLLLVLDDLHAADDPSMLLLQFLARDLRGARLLVVGTYRDVEAAWSPGVAGVRLSSRLTVTAGNRVRPRNTAAWVRPYSSSPSAPRRHQLRRERAATDERAAGRPSSNASRHTTASP
jgi:AAA ATPase domain